MKVLPNTKATQKGQALLVVLLVLSVVLTIALSTVSRSITDISISTTEEDSLRAFSAAEAGIEEALVSAYSGPLSDNFGERSEYKVEFPDAKPSENQMVHPREFLSGETATFWFVSQNDDGMFACDSEDSPCMQADEIEFCWGSGDESQTPPAVEISLYYDQNRTSLNSQNYSDIEISRMVFDPQDDRRQNNSFDEASNNCTFNNSLAFSTNSLDLSGGNNFDLPDGCNGTVGCLLFARVRFFYNDVSPQSIGFATTGPATSRVPAQGVLIESTGFSGESARKVNVFQSFAEPPEIFDNAVFSQNNLVKTR